MLFRCTVELNSSPIWPEGLHREPFIRLNSSLKYLCKVCPGTWLLNKESVQLPERSEVQKEDPEAQVVEWIRLTERLQATACRAM